MYPAISFQSFVSQCKRASNTKIVITARVRTYDGKVMFSQVCVCSGGKYPIQPWTGGGYPIQPWMEGGYPIQPWMGGVPDPALEGGTPTLDRGGTHPMSRGYPKLGWGVPHLRGYPIPCPGGTPTLDGGRGTPSHV